MMMIRRREKEARMKVQVGRRKWARMSVVGKGRLARACGRELSRRPLCRHHLGAMGAPSEAMVAASRQIAVVVRVVECQRCAGKNV